MFECCAVCGQPSDAEEDVLDLKEAGACVRFRTRRSTRVAETGHVKEHANGFQLFARARALSLSWIHF